MHAYMWNVGIFEVVVNILLDAMKEDVIFCGSHSKVWHTRTGNGKVWFSGPSPVCSPLLPYPLTSRNKPQQRLYHHCAYWLLCLSSSVANTSKATACLSHHFMPYRVTGS